MAHAAGVGYSSTKPGASGFKSKPAAPAPAAAAAATPASSAGSAGDGGGWSVPAPDVSDWSVPGESPLEKALIVLGVLILGLGVYSRLTGKTINLGLAGFGSPPLSQPALGSTIAARAAAANPARLGA